MLIGICGSKQSGKDTVGKYLEKYLKGSVNKLKFATPVVDIANILTGVDFYTDYEKVKETKLPEFNLKGRDILQYIGTEFGRTLCDDVWINRLNDKIDLKHDHTIITDVRFKNEAEFIINKGGILIKVIKDTIINNDTHISEHDLDNFNDYNCIIMNIETLEILEEKVKSFVDFATNELLINDTVSQIII